MKMVHTSCEEFRIGHIVSMLEQSGIEYVMRNQYLSGALGELPATECWPEIWVAHDEDYNAAMEIVSQATQELTDNGPWVCQCGESNEGQFGSCWKCGADKPMPQGEE